MAKDFKIKDFLKRIKNTVEINDGVSYKRVTVSGNHKGVSLRDKVDGSKIGTKKQFTITGGDFILSKIDARNGAFGIIPKSLDGAIITGNFWTYKVDTQLVDIEWFFYFTHSFNFIQICIESSTGTTHRKYLNEKVFLNHKIVLPSKAEQVEMVKRYKEQSKLSIKIKEEIEHQKQLLSQLKQSILQEAIQGKLTKEWRKHNPIVEPATELLKRINSEKAKLIKEKIIKKEKSLPPISEDKIPFEIPDGWVWCRLGIISNLIHYGFNASAIAEKKDIRLLRITDIQNNQVDWESVPGCDYSEKDLDNYLLSENDIVIARTGGTIGKSYIVKNLSVKSLFASYLIRVVPNKNNNADYIKSFIESPTYWKQLFDLAWGAGQPNVNGTSLKSLMIPLPPLAEQKTIVEKVKTLLQKCNALEQQITQSEEHANMLMQAVLKEAFEAKKKEVKKTKVISLPQLQPKEQQYFIKRKMLASYIINKSVNDARFGDTKFEKLLHLADYHVLKRNLGQAYKQKAAGPYDNKFTYAFFKQTIEDGWFYKRKHGDLNRILPGQHNSKSQSTYNFFSENELLRIDSLIQKFSSFDYRAAEIISTLYAVWNNRLINKQEITDEFLIHDFLKWSKEKVKYWRPNDQITPGIKWMKDNGIIPDGWGGLILPPKSRK